MFVKAIVELDNVSVTGNSFGLGVVACNSSSPSTVDLTRSTISGTAS